MISTIVKSFVLTLVSLIGLSLCVILSLPLWEFPEIFTDGPFGIIALLCIAGGICGLIGVWLFSFRQELQRTAITKLGLITGRFLAAGILSALCVSAIILSIFGLEIFLASSLVYIYAALLAGLIIYGIYGIIWLIKNSNNHADAAKHGGDSH